MLVELLVGYGGARFATKSSTSPTHHVRNMPPHTSGLEVVASTAVSPMPKVDRRLPVQTPSDCMQPEAATDRKRGDQEQATKRRRTST